MRRVIKQKRKTKRLFQPRKKFCRLCREKIKKLDYKDRLLERFITDRGKIASRRQSGNCARHQRMLAQAIKRARFISLLPYVK
jgi:small subunit ribosomal protein S18